MRTFILKGKDLESRKVELALNSQKLEFIKFDNDLLETIDDDTWGCFKLGNKFYIGSKIQGDLKLTLSTKDEAVKYAWA